MKDMIQPCIFIRSGSGKELCAGDGLMTGGSAAWFPHRDSRGDPETCSGEQVRITSCSANAVFRIIGSVF